MGFFVAFNLFYISLKGGEMKGLPKKRESRAFPWTSNDLFCPQA